MPFETSNDNALVLAALQMKFYTGNVQNFNDSTTMTERMRILSNGNVGIGLNTPAQKLDVAGRIRADTMEIDSYIYHVGDTNSYLGFNNGDEFKINVGGYTSMRVDNNQRVGFSMSHDPGYDVHVSGDLFGRHLLYGGDADTGQGVAISCLKTRDSGGHPYVEFHVYAPTFMGWIPFTYTITVSSVNTNGSSHLHRLTHGHGRYYNGSHYINETSGVAFTSRQSGSDAYLKWQMNDYGRDQTILSVHINFEGGIKG